MNFIQRPNIHFHITIQCLGFYARHVGWSLLVEFGDEVLQNESPIVKKPSKLTSTQGNPKCLLKVLR